MQLKRIRTGRQRGAIDAAELARLQALQQRIRAQAQQLASRRAAGRGEYRKCLSMGGFGAMAGARLNIRKGGFSAGWAESRGPVGHRSAPATPRDGHVSATQHSRLLGSP